ncbi:MAG: hypothetical protein ABIQ07_03475 [Ginsengibacter sp.]
MKIVLTFAACFFTTVLLFLSCSKDPVIPPPVIPPPVAVNQPPVARAGADTTFTLSSCSANISVQLDGTKSSDPENKITSSIWRLISGPPEFITISRFNFLYTPVEIRRAGVYSFELQIVDNGNLTSKDTVTITIIGASPKEYDLDITSNAKYTFYDNVKDCYYGPPCDYYDYTEILGFGTFTPIGVLNISLYEYTDTAKNIYGTSSLSVHNDNYSNNIYGGTSINFKKLIQQGGGAFSGNFNVTEGSAKACDTSLYKNLAPLLITGNLDTATKKVSIRIKGKTVF